jgi:hypothetical protein
MENKINKEIVEFATDDACKLNNFSFLYYHSPDPIIKIIGVNRVVVWLSQLVLALPAVSA